MFLYGQSARDLSIQQNEVSIVVHSHPCTGYGCWNDFITLFGWESRLSGNVSSCTVTLSFLDGDNKEAPIKSLDFDDNMPTVAWSLVWQDCGFELLGIADSEKFKVWSLS